MKNQDDLAVQPSASAPAVSEKSAPAETAPAPSERSCGPVALAVAGLVAAALGWWGIDQYGDYFPIAEEVRNYFSQSAVSPEQAAELNAALKKQMFQNTSLSLGLLGLAAGVVFGLSEGLVRRSGAGLARGVLGGAILGAGLGIMAGLSGTLLHYQFRSASLDPMIETILTHGGELACIGLATGVAAGLPSGSRPLIGGRAAAGIAGALLGAILFSPAAAFLFPLENMDGPIPQGRWSSLFWVALPLVLMGALIGMQRKR